MQDSDRLLAWLLAEESVAPGPSPLPCSSPSQAAASGLQGSSAWWGSQALQGSTAGQRGSEFQPLAVEVGVGPCCFSQLGRTETGTEIETGLTCTLMLVILQLSSALLLAFAYLNVRNCLLPRPTTTRGMKPFTLLACAGRPGCPGSHQAAGGRSQEMQAI